MSYLKEMCMQLVGWLVGWLATKVQLGAKCIKLGGLMRICLLPTNRSYIYTPPPPQKDYKFPEKWGARCFLGGSSRKEDPIDGISGPGSLMMAALVCEEGSAAHQLRQTKGRHENFRYPCLTTECECVCGNEILRASFFLSKQKFAIAIGRPRSSEKYYITRYVYTSIYSIYSSNELSAADPRGKLRGFKGGN